MSSVDKEDSSLPQASANLVERAETSTSFDTIIPAIKQSIKWSILVYGINEFNYRQEQNDHHMSLLSGILGEQVTADKQIMSNFSFSKNRVTVTVHVGSNAGCKVTHEDVDLLLLFIPVERDVIDESFTGKIKQITEMRGVMVWKHSVIILTGVDVIVNMYGDKGNNVATCLETLFNTWTNQIQRVLAPLIGANRNVTKTDVLIRPAGRQSQPDLPKPHEKWFSQLWLGCYISSKVHSMPAILKIAQRRIANKITNREISDLTFSQQPIQAKENSVDLPQNLKLGLGIGGSTAIAGAAAIGATTGALIGALAIGIPSFGVAAGTGLALGAVIGGGVGAGIAGAAVGGSYQAAKNKQLEEISASELKLYYAELLTRLPKVSAYLKKWADSQVSCRIVVTGAREEGVSTVAAALTGKEPREGGSGLYWKQVIRMKANLVVHDFKGFSNDVSKQEKVNELVAFVKSKDTNLFIFCIPMTSAKEDLVYSPHLKFLERLFETDKNILFNMVIALTHANEMRAEMRRSNDLSLISFQQFFSDELEGWKKQIKQALSKYIQIDDKIAEKVPVIPVGNLEPSINLSISERPSPATQYHWLSELLLHAMLVIKPEGLPTLIETNRKRIQNQPNEYSVCDRAHELIFEARCSMFQKIGLRDKKHPGEALGLIHGINDEHTW